MKRTPMVLFLVGTLVFVGAGAAAAQGTSKPEGSSTMEQMLHELRALRTEMQAAAAAGLRAQLLVARLVLQEQRINATGRELVDIQSKLQANEALRPIAEMWKSMGAEPKPGAAAAQESNPALEAIRGQAELLDKSNQDLKARHAELSRILAEDQARWTAFNAQLEALERSLQKQ